MYQKENQTRAFLKRLPPGMSNIEISQRTHKHKVNKYTKSLRSCQTVSTRSQDHSKVLVNLTRLHRSQYKLSFFKNFQVCSLDRVSQCVTQETS